MYFIGVDNGAARTRTVVLDLETTSLVAQSEQSYGLIQGLPAGHREQDPSLWVHAVDHTVRDCLSQLGEGRSRVAGMGVSGQSHGMVLLDAENRIVCPAKLAGDRSAERQCEELSRAFGGAPGLIELTGNALHSSLMAPRMRWLKQNEPYHFQRVVSCLSPHDFLNYWLGGVKRSEYGEASVSGFLNVRTRKWCRELTDYIDPRLGDMLPAVGSSREAVGVLRPELAREWGISEEVLLSAGGAEEMMTALGAGAATNGAVSISTNASTTICGVSDRPVIDPHGEVAAYCDATDRWMPLARNAAAAACSEQVQRHYGWNLEQLEAALLAGEPGAHGLMFLPLPASGKHPEGTGALVGITGANFSPVNVARASSEALALEFGRGLRRMIQLGFSPSDVHLSGRIASHPSWRQLLADVLGLPVLTAKPQSCSALGAALQAAVTFFRQSGENLSYSEMTSYAVLPEQQTLCSPNIQRHEFYRELMERHDRLAESLRDDVF
jgi:xylulokinase